MNERDIQEDAINHKSGHARLIAGPGTGKTKCIVGFIKTLVEERQEDPTRILPITFSHATAQELQERLEELSLEDGCPEARTLHSYSFQQLRKRSGNEFVGQHIMDEWEVKNLLCVDLGERLNKTAAFVAQTINDYDAAWRTLQVPPSAGFRSLFETEIRNLRVIYNFALLGELVYMFKRLLDGDPDYIPELDFMLVDEYQDLNACDLAVIKELVSRSNCDLYAAGDDDQCLYAFRHADPAGIRNFHDDYSDATDYPLNMCHRCGEPILEKALLLMQHEDGRIEKDINAVHVEGQVHVYAFRSVQQQVNAVVEIVKYHIGNGIDLSEIMILVPRGALANMYVEKMASENIPASNLASPEELLNNPSVRRLIYAIRFSKDETDAIAVRGWLQTVSGIGPKSVALIVEHCLTTGGTLVSACENVGNQRVKTAIEDLRTKADEFRDVETFEAVIQESTTALGLNEQVVEKLRGYAKGLHAEEDAPEVAVEKLQESEEEPEQATEVEEKVRIMTLRKAKGLSAKVVIVTDLDDEIMPADMEIAEQRRLLYVSMTRARQFLYLTHVTYRRGPTSFAGTGARASGPTRRRSRFIDELGISSETFRSGS